MLRSGLKLPSGAYVNKTNPPIPQGDVWSWVVIALVLCAVTVAPRFGRNACGLAVEDRAFARIPDRKVSRQNPPGVGRTLRTGDGLVAKHNSS